MDRNGEKLDNHNIKNIGGRLQMIRDRDRGARHMD
jgi:hypothetical protein